jgi:hypothetical protein
MVGIISFIADTLWGSSAYHGNACQHKIWPVTIILEHRWKLPELIFTRRMLESTRIFATLFLDPFFRQHSPVPILTGFFKKTENRDVDQKLISPIQQNRWFTPSTNVRLWQSGMTRSPFDNGIRAPWSHLKVGRNGWALSNKPSVDPVHQIACGSYQEPSRRRS